MLITSMKVTILFMVGVSASLSTLHAAEVPRVIALEVITEAAATGDGGNAWGGTPVPDCPH